MARIDTHIHLYDPAMGVYSWPAPGSPFYRLISAEEYAQACVGEEARAVVVGCSSEYELNEKLCALCQKDPRAAVYVAQFDPEEEQMPEYAKKLARYPVYRGFRVSCDGALRHKERVAKAWIPGTVIELLGNYTVTLKLYDWMKEHPEISFVVEHFGLHLFTEQPVPQEYKDACTKLAELPNVSIKVSGMFTLCKIPGKPLDTAFYREAYQAVVDAFGEDRCMYGSDWPVMGVPLSDCDVVSRELARICCGESAVEKIMGDNAARIYRISGEVGGN